MAPKQKEGDVVFSLNGKYISWAHTVVAYAAFIGALIVGVSLHYHKIVENEHYGYPDEWFPSVSATIGDRYPERSVFMVFIAITSGPRFALVGLWYFLTRRPNTSLPGIIAATGVFRTVTCGGWTYVTSTDDHNWHDIFMISYLVATLPWTLGCLALSPPNPKAIQYRKILAGLFFGTLVPLIYFFIQHKVHKVAGAYTIYAFFEWALILFDVGFDAVTALDFETFEVVVKDVKGLSRGDAKLLKDSVKEKERDSALIQTSTFEGPYYWPAMLDATADILHGFFFWSILTSLGVLVWYFPLWHMGISGYEAMIMCTVSPVLLSIPPIRSLAIKYNRWVHMSSLVGLLAWLVKDPAYRLFTVSFALAAGCLAWSAEWYAERRNSARLQSRILAWTIGLILSSIAKFANHTNNPVWPIMNAENGGWNKTGLIVAILAVWRSTRPVSVSGGDYVPPNAKKGSGLMAGLGLAGLFFGMHSLLSDSSTMILWVWEGFPVRGPLAVPHGAVTILAMSAGLFVGIALPSFLTSWTAYGLGAVGAALLTLYPEWTGYYGGLLLAFYLMGVAPSLIASAVQHNPALTFGFGYFIYNIMLLFHVWVVAYAFVPGGPLVREHTDWVMITTMLLVGAGVFSALITNTSHQQKSTSSPRGRKQTAYYLHILLALQLLTGSIAYLRFPTNNYEPYHKDDKLITAGIWTIHFSLDNDMWSSERRMAAAIKELELDVVGLLESDNQRIIMGNRDTTQYLAEDLGMYVDYGPGPNKHTWGSALLSKFPILNSTHHLLPSPVGELAPAIEATLDVYGTPIDVFVFHSGQEEDPEDRRLQSEYLAKAMRATPRPAILLSYLVIKPGEGNYNTYVGEKSGMRDIEPSDWDRWCEYILYKDIKRVGYARVSRGTITDTEIQVGKFVVGEPASYSNERISEEQVPPGRRFPALFRGEGVRGHRYHVFDEPWYYA
ncbi:Frag1/DRAM/Sfk1 family-domain-containing protein [Exophiala viscosa]|uniref:Frag1/DRAM/Sfk1 family-domain-containing protein n=1 Tax=Exophiala viscosa TaxID=2486360 RepID=A0AAN6DP09_9EURO|nr:Frag1/DRAM/Sfk1 family-domain-containing protein [Exophiala viscosa]